MQTLDSVTRCLPHLCLQRRIPVIYSIGTRHVSKAALDHNSYARVLRKRKQQPIVQDSRSRTRLEHRKILHGHQRQSEKPELDLFPIIKPKSVESYASERLRILFCGSDTWSAGILKYFCKAKRKQNLDIDTIEVLCMRTPAWGNHISDPIRRTAKEFGLKLHDLEGFDKFSLDRGREDGLSPNIIITAAFPALIPARLIDQVKWKGLHLHPGLIYNDPERESMERRRNSDYDYLTRYNPVIHDTPPIEALADSKIEVTGLTLMALDPHDYLKGEVLRQWEFKIRRIKPRRLSPMKKFIVHSINLLREQLRLAVYKRISKNQA